LHGALRAGEIYTLKSKRIVYGALRDFRCGMFLSMMNGKQCLQRAMLPLLFCAAYAKAQTVVDPCAAVAVESAGYQVQASAPDAAAGSKLEIIVTPAPQQSIAAVCFDSTAAAAPEVLKGPDRTIVRISIPAHGSAAGYQNLPAGTYAVRLLLAPAPPATVGVLLETTLRVPLALKAIRPHAIGPAGEPFTVSLLGSGFDAWTPSNNLLLIDGEPRDVCWTDSECNARHSRLRGVAAPGELAIAGLDPAEERNAEFRVRVGQESSGPLRDEAAGRRWATALTISALVSLGLIGIVLLLVRTVRKETVRGEDYILRLLFLDKETNTYSLSKLQFYIWTIAAVFGYIYLAIAKNYFQQVFGLPPIPAGLPGIVGISAGTAVAAQVVTSINGPKGAGQTKPSLSDLVTSGEVVAAERVQFLIWTLIGAVGFVVVTARLDPWTLRDLPDIPATLLTISGISAFGYLGGKLARDPGPVINEIVMSTGPDPDDAQAAGPFGLIELRGRTLSQDALFRVDDVELSFNKLRQQKPRIVERDADSKQDTIAKRLRLVVLLDQETAPLFAPRSEHAFAIMNPDSQRAVFQVKVPESQKPG
jgi:hypothetical protein